MNRAVSTQNRNFAAKAIVCLVLVFACIPLLAPTASAGGGSQGPCDFTFPAPYGLVGTNSSDFLVGDDRANNISGLGGNDRLYGCGGNDNINGGADNDFIDGGRGDDYLSGDSGNDTIIGGPGFDVAVGGSGFDRCDAEVEVGCEANPSYYNGGGGSA